MDVVALASVIGSSGLALGTLLVGHLNSKQQRNHEAALAYESRAWEQKSEALFRTIRAARAVCDAIQSERNPALRTGLGRVDTLRAIHALRAELAEVLPVIEAYGSENARRDLHQVHAVMQEVYFEPAYLEDIAEYRTEKAKLIEAQDFDAAAALRDREVAATGGLFETVTLDAPKLERALLALIESARLSVRGDGLPD